MSNSRASVKQVESETKKTITRLDNVASDEVNLEAKINKRKVRYNINFMTTHFAVH